MAIMKSLYTILLSTLFISLLAQPLKVYDLRVEQLSNPMGLDSRQPRFSWKLQSEMPNTIQSAYEVTVSTSPDFNKKTIVWNTRQTSDQSVYITYAGLPLTSNTTYYWKLIVWDNHEHMTSSTQAAWWHTGLFDQKDWTAKWISPIIDTTIKELFPSPMLRKEFNIKKEVRSATLYISSKGLYEAKINGARVGQDYLTPGWTSYNHRIQYQAYDVTSQLTKGMNAIGITLGKGWFGGEVGWIKNTNIYGGELSAIAQIMLTLKDGSTMILATDDSWTYSTGPILFSEIYHGERYDARKENDRWATPGNTTGSWKPVKVQPYDLGVLIGTYNEPVRKHETIKPVKWLITPEGDTVLDFGQNMVGWVKVSATGPAGTEITLSHAEVLDKFGNFYTENLRHAKESNTYILKGKGEETFEPHFTFQGFRFIKVQGYPGPISLDKFEGIVLYSDMQRVGTYECSNTLINQLQHNIQWGQRGNFLDVPTDCPQRDERLGWTGDAQAFSRTAAYNFDVQNFFAKWLQDLSADQNPDGGVPHVIPNALRPEAAASAGWADAATIIPWNMYTIYGDTSFLKRQYPSMKKWVQYMVDSSNQYLWNKGFHFGDWLFYSLGDDRDGRSAVTDKYLIAQCFFANSVDIMINSAEVLGKSEDQKYYKDLLNKVKSAFRKEYVTGSGRLVSSTQTAYVLVLQFDMLEEGHREVAAKRLADNVKSYNYHITTGFLGTPYICHVLSRYGYTDLAYRLLLQDTYPSWLYPVKMGATTIWERWDGIKPDSTFQSASMNSFNHYAYGAIGDWMYRVVCGLEIEQPGYKKSVIQPMLSDSLSYAKSSTMTPYGLISSGWNKKSSSTEFTIEIPVNTTSTILLPISKASIIKLNGMPIDTYEKVKIIERKDDRVSVQVGSGKYLFEVSK